MRSGDLRRQWKFALGPHVGLHLALMNEVCARRVQQVADALPAHLRIGKRLYLPEVLGPAADEVQGVGGVGAQGVAQRDGLAVKPVACAGKQAGEGIDGTFHAGIVERARQIVQPTEYRVHTGLWYSAA